MRLLVVTDHSFLRHKDDVLDTYCFDRGFFDDYHRVFDSVAVLCRMTAVESLPTGARRSDGCGVHFIAVPNVHGLDWYLRAKQISNPVLRPAIDQVDAVIARVPSGLGWLAAREAKVQEKPYMLEVIGDPLQAYLSSGRGPGYWLVACLEWWRLKYLARYAEAASYVSKHHLQRTYPLASGKPHESISSIRLARDHIQPAREFIGSAGLFKIIQVASLTPRKRHQDLILACRRLLDQGIEVEVHFAGSGPTRNQLEALCNKLDVVNNVIFHGHIADQQILTELLDSSDLFVLTSASEGLPRAILEAMARGLPVIGTRTGGVDELVREPQLFRVGDVHALTTLIADLVEMPARLTEMSCYSVKVAKQYTSEILSPRRVRLYRYLRSCSLELQTTRLHA